MEEKKNTFDVVSDIISGAIQNVLPEIKNATADKEISVAELLEIVNVSGKVIINSLGVADNSVIRI